MIEKLESLKLSDKYKNNDAVEILFVSEDPSKDRWLSFHKNKNLDFGKNLFIKNGRVTEFGKNYNIQTIPRYILIGKEDK